MFIGKYLFTSHTSPCRDEDCTHASVRLMGMRTKILGLTAIAWAETAEGGTSGDEANKCLTASLAVAVFEQRLAGKCIGVFLSA